MYNLTNAYTFWHTDTRAVRHTFNIFFRDVLIRTLLVTNSDLSLNPVLALFYNSNKSNIQIASSYWTALMFYLKVF